MTLQKDLLEQAHQLAHHEPRRPRQASLRRAVSTAYYAVFHLLVDAASREIVAGRDQEDLRHIVGRALRHSQMKKACQALANWNPNNPPRPLAGVLPGGPPQVVVTVASAFVELQQARHEADYALSRRFSRSDVLALIELADAAFSTFASMKKGNADRRIFLLSLLFHEHWKP